MPVNYSKAFGAMGYTVSNLNEPLKIVNSHHYYIQYGPDTIITILDPGEGLKPLGVIIKEWDFAGRITQLTHYINHARKYSITLDTIPFSRDESRFDVKNLCGNVTQHEECDSILIIPKAEGNSYTVKCVATLPNLAFHGLFYPDLAFLPEKIYKVGFGNETMSLDTVMYGKIAVDSLLESFSVDGYELITENDLGLIDRRKVLELIEEFDRKTMKKSLLK